MAPSTAGSRQTRSATGHSTPRIVAKVEEAVGIKPKATKKKTAASKKSATAKKPAAKAASKPSSKPAAKANTSKPRTKAATGAGVKKPAAKAKKPVAKKPAATKKEPVKVEAKKEESSGPTLMGAIQGAALKVTGALTGSSGKKAAGTAKIRGNDAATKKAKGK